MSIVDDFNSIRQRLDEIEAKIEPNMDDKTRENCVARFQNVTNMGPDADYMA